MAIYTTYDATLRVCLAIAKSSGPRSGRRSKSGVAGRGRACQIAWFSWAGLRKAAQRRRWQGG